MNAKALHQRLLDIAIQGRLVDQDPNDEPASLLLKRIRTEKERLVKEGKLKKANLNDSIIYKAEDNKYYEKTGKETECIDDQIPFEIPSSWEWVRLLNVSDLYTGNSISADEKKKKFIGVDGKEYIGTKDVLPNGEIVYENGVKITNEELPHFKIAPKNSTLLCVEGGSAGRKIGILDRDVCFGNKLCCFVPIEIDSRFLFYFLQSPIFIAEFKEKLTGIIGGVSVDTLRSLLLPLPPLSEQGRIVGKLEELFGVLDRLSGK